MEDSERHEDVGSPLPVTAIVAAVAGCAVVLIGVLGYLSLTGEAGKREIVIATGPETGTYHALGTAFGRLLETDGIVGSAQVVITEGSAENIFIVRDGELITPAASENILEGVTRKTIMELARTEFGLETTERQIDRSELYIADEVFFCGTGVQVVAVIEVDGRPVGDGKIGPIVEKIRGLYFDVVKGKVEKYKHWCTPVY